MSLDPVENWEIRRFFFFFWDGTSLHTACAGNRRGAIGKKIISNGDRSFSRRVERLLSVSVFFFSSPCRISKLWRLISKFLEFEDAQLMQRKHVRHKSYGENIWNGVHSATSNRWQNFSARLCVSNYIDKDTNFRKYTRSVCVLHGITKYLYDTIQLVIRLREIPCLHE